MNTVKEYVLEIKNYSIKTIIGIYEEELKNEQNLTVSLTTSYTCMKRILEDDIELVVDYDKVTTFINSFSKNHNYKLLESFAYALHMKLSTHFSLKILN